MLILFHFGPSVFRYQPLSDYQLYLPYYFLPFYIFSSSLPISRENTNHTRTKLETAFQFCSMYLLQNWDTKRGTFECTPQK